MPFQKTWIKLLVSYGLLSQCIYILFQAWKCWLPRLSMYGQKWWENTKKEKKNSICVPKINVSLTGLEQHEGRGNYDKILIVEWTNHLNSVYQTYCKAS